MDAVAITVGCSWIVAGLLTCGLSLPLVRGRVARNPLYGVRFPQSFASEDAWYAINRYGGRQLCLWSLPMIAVGVVSLFLPLQTHVGLTLLLGFAPLLFLMIALVRSWRFARQYDSAG